MKIVKHFAHAATALCLAAGICAAEPATVNDVYPGILNGALSTASFGQVPEGTIVQYGDESVTAAELGEILAGAPAAVKPQLEKNALFLVQELATKELLARAAREAAAKNGTDVTGKSAGGLIGDHLQAHVADVSVSDEELKAFYDQNQDMFGGASFEKVQRALREFVRKQKRQEKVDEYVRGLGGVYGAVIAEDWGKRHAELALDNPVDKARLNKLPTMVDFGATGCRPCEMMAPILETLKTKYAGKADILFVHVQQEQFLATRFGISSIPVQVFFDKAGKGTFRHTGFFSQEDIEKKLAELGAE